MRYLREDYRGLPATLRARSPGYPVSLSARGPLGGELDRGATDAHLAERRYQSRSDDWLYRSLRRYVLRGGKKRTRPRGRRRDVAARVANEGGERGRGIGENAGEILPLSPPDTTGLSDTESAPQRRDHPPSLALLSLSPSLFSLSLYLSTSRFLSPSVSSSFSTLIPLLFSFGLTPLLALEVRR